MNHTAINTGSEALPVARALARSLRPHQWVKNLLVFGGLLFSQSLSDPVAVLHSGHAFLLFCFAASSIYLLNDVNDREAMHLVGFPVAVADAHPAILTLARLVLTRSGGRGAVRELCDLVLARAAVLQQPS